MKDINVGDYFRNRDGEIIEITELGNVFIEYEYVDCLSRGIITLEGLLEKFYSIDRNKLSETLY